MSAVVHRLAKAIADLVPLADLASGNGGSRVASGGDGADPGVRSTGAGDPRPARPASDDDGGGGGTPGPLPFTGLALITLALVGSALVGVGGRLRRSAAAAVVPEPLQPAPIPTRRSSAVPLLALVGLATIALLVARPGRPS